MARRGLRIQDGVKERAIARSCEALLVLQLGLCFRSEAWTDGDGYFDVHAITAWSPLHVKHMCWRTQSLELVLHLPTLKLLQISAEAPGCAVVIDGLAFDFFDTVAVEVRTVVELHHVSTQSLGMLLHDSKVRPLPLSIMWFW